MYGKESYGRQRYQIASPDVPAKPENYFVDLAGYAPPFLAEVLELAEIYRTEGPEIGLLQHELRDLLDQCFIETATWGLLRWEKMLGVATNMSLTYEQRREILMAKLRGHGTTTKRMIEETAATFSGGEVNVIEDNPNHLFVIQFIGIKGIPRNMQAFINMLALLGWNPGTEQEIFSMQELIDSFSLERVSKSGARFQPDKAKWFNAQYMHHKSDAELAALYQPILREHGIEVSDELAGRAAGIMKERATFITDLWDLTSFFFVAPTQYDEKQAKKYWKGDNPAMLRELREVLAGIDDFSLENTERIVHGWIEQKGYSLGQVMNTLRLALVGAGKGPGMYDVTSFIGKEETLRRIDNLLRNLKPGE